MIHLLRLRAHDFKQLRDVELTFPRRGTFLVQGPNEAGKSTLFEAVFVALFGRPLDNKRLDELIRYGAEEAIVELEVGLSGGRILSVSRRIRRTRSVYHLTLRKSGADEPVEELRAAGDIADRIEAELGFDGDAMLDTCFVEQKKLDKLEGMSLRQREASLMKLLNLDRLLRLGEELKVTRDDERTLERLALRRDLARVQAELPTLRAAHRRAVARWNRARASEAVVAAREQLADVVEMRNAARTAAEAARQAESKATALERIGSAVQAAREGETATERLAEALDAVAVAERELQDARHEAAREDDIVHRGMRLRRVRRRLEFLGRLDAEREELERWVDEADRQLERLATLRASLNQTRRKLVEARATEREQTRATETLSNDLAAFEVREALQEWEAAVGASEELQDPRPAIQRFRDAAEDVIRRARRQAAFISAIFLVSATASWVASSQFASSQGVGPRWVWAARILALAALLLLGARLYGAWRRHHQLTADLARLEGRATVHRERRAALEERARRAADRLGDLRAGRPATLERAREDIDVLAARLDGRTRTEVAAARQEASDLRARATADIERLVERERELREQAGPVDAAALQEQRGRKAQRARKIEGLLDRRRPKLSAEASSLGVALEAGAIEREMGSLRADLRRVREISSRIPHLERQVAERRAAAEQRGAAARAARDALRRALEDSGLAMDGVGAAALETPRAPVRADGREGEAEVEQTSGRSAEQDAVAPVVADPGAWRRTVASLERIYEERGGASVRAVRDDAMREAATAAADYRGAVRTLRERMDGLGALLAEIPDATRWSPIDWPEAPDPRRERALSPAVSEALDSVRRALDGPSEDKSDGIVNGTFDGAVEPSNDAGSWDADELSNRVEDARRAVDVAEHEHGRLERALGLSGEVLDLGECRRALAKAERDVRVRRRAAEIVDVAGRNVVQQVMPSTIEHMRRLLPSLTSGRYFDAQLSEDYRIEVYDERAEAWLRKNIFSGGTRDQLSLALRLAFALATLPEERGAAPGFLFLDEPLGAFDQERANALLALLTEGEVAESFDQVFLISHVRVDPALFDHRVILEDGRIQESTLADGD